MTDFPVRITENRCDNDSNSTIVVGDLGERRFPVTRISVTTPDGEFVKRVAVSFAMSPLSKSWTEVYSGSFYRIKVDGAITENLHADFSPNTDRYIRIGISGRSGPSVVVDNVSVKGFGSQADLPAPTGPQAVARVRQSASGLKGARVD